jgi:hypothetical protein
LINPRSRGDEDDMSMGGASHLDALARQILPIVKRMMAIERERRPVR